jgi:hypothetical protein
MRGVAVAIIEARLDSNVPLSTAEVASAAGISRQAAHKWLKVMVDRGLLEVRGKARAARYVRAAPKRTLLAVATIGASFRLQARLLLTEVPPGGLVLDFLGCEEVTEEFLDEVFIAWAPVHPLVRLEVENFPVRFIEVLDRVLEHAPRQPGAPATQTNAPPQASALESTDWAAQ